MKKIILIILSFFIIEFAFATGQVPDYLIIEKDTVAIFSNPLEQYFVKIGNRELPNFKGCGSTACWRGYKAIWELKDDSLFLRAITSCHKGDWCQDIQDADLQQMFGTKNVFADWFTGNIIVPQGERVQYIHMGYASIYERELHITFKKGKKIKERIKSNKKIEDKILFSKKEREISKEIQDTLFYYVKNKINWEKIGNHRTLMCDEKYIITFNKKGEIKKIKLNFQGETFREKIDNWWWNNITDRKCRSIMKKALKPLNLSYLNLPNKDFEIDFEIFYNSEKKELELWKEFWMEN